MLRFLSTSLMNSRMNRYTRLKIQQWAAIHARPRVLLSWKRNNKNVTWSQNVMTSPKSLCNAKTKRDKFKSLGNAKIKRGKFKSKKISVTWKYRLRHRKCDVRIFIHELQNFGKRTSSLRSLARFPKFCNSWIKICTKHFLCCNLFIVYIARI